MNIVILTGAGISVESGLSAFRGPQGLWEASRPMRRIEQAVQACDVFLAIGTSDTVYPAAGLVDIAVEAGAQAHQLNIERTVGSHRYGACHIGPATTVVPAWVDALLANRLI